MSFSNATKVFIASVLTVPLTYVYNMVMLLIQWDTTSPVVWLIGALFILTVLSVSVVRSSGSHGYGVKKQDNYQFYVFAVSSVSGVVALIIALELDGIISGFMGVFLKVVEPNLRSAHGTMMCYWHGTGMYAMNLLIVTAISWNNSFIEVGLFWCGSIANSMVVLLLAALSGKHGLTWGTLLYVSFALISAPEFLKIWRQRQIPKTGLPPLPVRKRSLDCLCMLFLTFASFMAVFRGLAILGADSQTIQDYVTYIEPYLALQDPAPFPRIQMLVYLFYFLPLYIVTAYGLVFEGCYWVPDITVIHAGAAVQAQIIHIGASLHPRTPYVQRVPPNGVSLFLFWAINLLLLVGPIFMAWNFWNNFHFASREAITRRDSTQKKE
ncbi:transmembrane 6 superfamily member 1-like isoform X1 [Tachypleus tridentatus]|uniref:transmembrane 6 superfamily member 1-like isoform X1 n=2 Tax=Tachypleus tridentatus TaxID=6853 RepID=UPI003FD0083F